MAVTTFRDQSINVPKGDRVIVEDKKNITVQKGGERLDNVASIMYGSHLLMDRLVDRNNIGFVYDVPPHKKIVTT